MLRFIYAYDPRRHVDSRDFKALSWLLVRDRVKYFKLIHVFKVVHGRAPDYLAKRFVPISSAHGYGTRSRTCDFVISKDLSRSLSSFSYTAIKDWNALPVPIKQINSEFSFKKRLKEHLSLLY